MKVGQRREKRTAKSIIKMGETKSGVVMKFGQRMAINGGPKNLKYLSIIKARIFF